MPEVRLIDANALKKAFCDYCSAIDTDMLKCTGNCDTLRIIDEQPTIEPEVRHGRWISEIVPWTDWKGQKRKRFQPTSCSVCHTPVADATNFCPNCGARMDAEDINVLTKDGGADNG